MLQTLKRLKLYKNLFVLFIALNVFCLSLGVVFSISHWLKRDQDYQSSQKLQMEFQLTQAIRHHVDVMDLNKSPKNKTSVNFKILEYQIWKKWQDYLSLNSSPNPTDAFYQKLHPYFVDFELSTEPKKWEELTDFLATHQEQVLLSTQKLHTKSLQNYQEWILVGLFTFLFGILIPMVLLGLITKQIWKAQKELMKKTSHWLEDIKKEHLQRDQAFRSPEFWLQMVLISLEHWAAHSPYPILKYSSEVSVLIKKELKKVNPDSVSQPKKDVA